MESEKILVTYSQMDCHMGKLPIHSHLIIATCFPPYSQDYFFKTKVIKKITTFSKSAQWNSPLATLVPLMPSVRRRSRPQTEATQACCMPSAVTRLYAWSVSSIDWAMSATSPVWASVYSRLRAAINLHRFRSTIYDAIYDTALGFRKWRRAKLKITINAGLHCGRTGHWNRHVASQLSLLGCTLASRGPYWYHPTIKMWWIYHINAINSNTT